MQKDYPGLWNSVREEGIPEAEAKSELEQILADPEFQCTPRNKRFLRYAAEQHFQGRGDAVKAYTIAVDVFGRPPSFDPSADPIVRIEATRLRASLIRYYGLNGHDRSIHIDLPRGHYVPVFSRAGEAASEATAEADLHIKTTVRNSRLEPSLRAMWISATVGILAGCALGAVFLAATHFRSSEGQSLSEKPRLAIEMRDDLAGDESIQFRDTLLAALSDFQTLRISAPEASTGSTNVAAPGNGLAGFQRRYRLQLRYGSDTGDQMLWWRLVDEGSGEIIRSERIDGSPQGASMQATAARLAVRLASGRGVINSIEAAGEINQPTLGNGCILRAAVAVNSIDRSALAEARTCLEETLAVRRVDGDARAALANVLLAIDPVDAPTKLTDEAVIRAAEAIALAPDSDRSYFARMVTQWRVGNVDSAITAGRRALELNPYNPATMAKLARILSVIGRWDEGVALARTADDYGMPLDDSVATLAFDAYRRGDYTRTLFLLTQVNDHDCYELRLLNLAALGQLGRTADARAAMADLRLSHPQFETSFRADLKRRQFVPSFIDTIEAGLTKAGVAAT